MLIFGGRGGAGWLGHQEAEEGEELKALNTAVEDCVVLLLWAFNIYNEASVGSAQTSFRLLYTMGNEVHCV